MNSGTTADDSTGKQSAKNKKKRAKVVKRTKDLKELEKSANDLSEAVEGPAQGSIEGSAEGSSSDHKVGQANVQKNARQRPKPIFDLASNPNVTPKMKERLRIKAERKARKKSKKSEAAEAPTESSQPTDAPQRPAAQAIPGAVLEAELPPPNSQLRILLSPRKRMLSTKPCLTSR